MRWLWVLEAIANLMLNAGCVLFAVLAFIDMLQGREALFYQRLTLAGVMYLAGSVTLTASLRAERKRDASR